MIFEYNSKFLIFLLMILPLVNSCAERSNSGNAEAHPNDKGEVLYNGIVLPKVWPPKYPYPEKDVAMEVPYLETPPEVIPINIGRQLFVDDFLIEENTLQRTFHYPRFYDQNPVIKPDKPWEKTDEGILYAAPFSDGIWYDEKDGKFKMWYLCGGGTSGHERATGYAESDDGKKWIKPILNNIPNTNLVNRTNRDGSTIYLDKSEKDSDKRYKIFNIERGEEKEWYSHLYYSADGISWTSALKGTDPIGDRSTVYYNPFRKVWVYSLRQSITDEDGNRNRIRNYLEDQDPEMLVKLAHSVEDHAKDTSATRYWFRAWDNEVRHPDFPDVKPGIYNHDAIAYESLFLGFFNVWQGPENNVCDSLGIQKRNELLLGYSRDGFHWDRPDMNRFMEVDPKEGAWNNGNMQSIGGVPLIVGDSLYFYSSGRQNNSVFWDSHMSTGLATLRRDGFASLDAKGQEGYVVTKKLAFSGDYLFINADASKGKIAVELLDENGKVIKGYAKTDCIPITNNGTKIKIAWKDNTQVKVSTDKVRIKFYLTNASMYAFWVSGYESGESGGYTAGGGPGLHPSGKDLPVVR